MHYKEVKSYQVKNNVINQPELLERVDYDYQLLDELTQIFMEDLPGQLKDIENALENDDGEKLKLSAHRLKGSLGNLAATEAHDLAMKLEISASQEDLTKAKYLYPNLLKQTQLVMEALESLTKNRLSHFRD